MRVFGLIGLLAAIAIILVAMVVVGKGVTGGGETPAVKTGADRAYDELKKDGDMDDPKETMRDALKGNL